MVKIDPATICSIRVNSTIKVHTFSYRSGIVVVQKAIQADRIVI